MYLFLYAKLCNSKSVQEDQAEAENCHTEEARTSKANCSEARCARDSRTAFWTTSEADAIFSVKSIWHPISTLATYFLGSEQASNTVHL